MLTNEQLLPKLSTADQQAFNKLTDAYTAKRTQVEKLGADAGRAYRKELGEKMKTAEGAELIRIARDVENFAETIRRALGAAKAQLRALNPKYGELFPRLIDAADVRANELINDATTSYHAHFKSFGIEPVGESPIVIFLKRWKGELQRKRDLIKQLTSATAGTTFLPSRILGYTVSENVKPAKWKDAKTELVLI